MLAQIVALLDELAGEIEAAPPRLDGLIGLRGIIETVDDEPDDVVEARRAAVARRLDRWRSTGWPPPAPRKAPACRRYCRRSARELAALVAAAARRAAAQPAAIRARLARPLAELAGLAPTMPEERVAQEVAMLVTRADIREELDRLRGASRPGRRSAAARRGGRPAARFPVPGAEPRSQHAVLEIGRYRADPHRPGAEGGDRAVPRADPERRMSAPATRVTAPRSSRRGFLLVLSSPSGRRQDDDHPPPARTRPEPVAVGLGDHPAAAARRDRRAGLPVHRPGPIRRDGRGRRIARTRHGVRQLLRHAAPADRGGARGRPRHRHRYRLAGHAAAQREPAARHRHDFRAAAEHGALDARLRRAPRTATRWSPAAWRNRPKR